MSRNKVIKYPPGLHGYEWDGILGSGTFADVYKALKAQQKSPVAIKCIHRSVNDNFHLAKREITILKLLNHENIVRFISVHVNESYIYIVLEYCSEGDLATLLKRKSQLPESFVQILTQQLTSGLKHLSDKRICHMDLKPDNIFITKDEKLQFKLGDFGLSQILPIDMMKYRGAGTIAYMAPEKITFQPFDARADLWSAGVIIFQCLYGCFPFSKHRHKSIFDFIRQQTQIMVSPSPTISSSCEDLLLRLLKYDPDERITIDDVLNHDFLKLNYMPSPENYEHVNNLIRQCAVFEKEKNYSEVLRLLKESILFLECFAIADVNPLNERNINKKLNYYKNWANRVTRYMDFQNRKHRTSSTQNDIKSEETSYSRKALKIDSIP